MEDSSEQGNDSLKHRPPLTPGIFLVLISVRVWINPRGIVRLDGLGKLKIYPVNPSVTEPASFRFAAQSFDQLSYHVLILYTNAEASSEDLAGCSGLKLCL
jgi:hypothetical protein